MGAVLIQYDDEKNEFVMAYASRSNNNMKSYYSLYEKVFGYNLGHDAL